MNVANRRKQSPIHFSIRSNRRSPAVSWRAREAVFDQFVGCLHCVQLRVRDFACSVLLPEWIEWRAFVPWVLCGVEVNSVFKRRPWVRARIFRMHIAYKKYIYSLETGNASARRAASHKYLIRHTHNSHILYSFKHTNTMYLLETV